MVKNKRGWIKIVEATIAILLIAGASLILLGNNAPKENDFSPEIYELETAILREVQLDDFYRDEILTAEPLPLNSDNPLFPEDIKNQILNKQPDYLNCSIKICEIEDPCIFDETSQSNLYVQSVLITANFENYLPRQLKLFCWEIN